MRKDFNIEKIGGVVRGIKGLRDGTVIIESKDEKQKEKVKEIKKKTKR